MAHRSYEQAKYFTLAFCNAFIAFSLLALSAALVPLGGSAGSVALAEVPQSEVPVEDFYRPRPEDSMDLLLVAQSEGGEYRFVLASLDVEQGSVTARYLPPGLMVRYRSTRDTLAALYGRDGPLAAKEALSGTLGVSVERWMMFGESELAQAADVFGPVNVTSGGVAVLDSGIPTARETRRLDGVALRELIFLPETGAGEVEAAVEAYLHAALLLAPQPEADDAFRTVVNLADTDLSYLDYDSRREALYFLAGLTKP